MDVSHAQLGNIRVILIEIRELCVQMTVLWVITVHKPVFILSSVQGVDTELLETYKLVIVVVDVVLGITVHLVLLNHHTTHVVINLTTVPLDLLVVWG